MTFLPPMLLILAVSYFPPAAFLLPLFRLFTGNIPGLGFVRLYNTPGSMILPFSALFMPLSIFILTTFYGQIPDGLEDAARRLAVEVAGLRDHIGRQAVRAGGVRYTIKDGIVYDARQLLDDVRQMVRAAKEAKGMDADAELSLTE